MASPVAAAIPVDDHEARVDDERLERALQLSLETDEERLARGIELSRITSYELGGASGSTLGNEPARNRRVLPPIAATAQVVSSTAVTAEVASSPRTLRI